MSDARAIEAQALLLFDSYARVVGQPLLPTTLRGAALAAALWQMPAVLVSHGLEADPLFNYANAAGLALFEMDWAQFTATPSRASAEPANQEARAKVMHAVETQGYMAGYSGVRLARGGDGLVQLGGSCGTGFVKGGGGLFEAILGEVPDVTALGTLQRLPGHGGGRSRILNG